MPRLYRIIKSYYDKLSIQEYNAIAKDQGLNNFESLLLSAIADSKKCNQNQDGVINGALSAIDKVINKFIPE